MEITLKCDKTVITVAYEDEPTGVIDRMRLMEWVDAARQGHWGKKVSWGPSKKGSTSYVSVPLPEGARLRVKYGYSTEKHRIWLQFNPSKASKEALFWIKFHIHQLFENGVQTLEDFGVFSHAEFAADVSAAEFSDHLFLDVRAKKGDAKYLPNGTFYIGSRHSDRQIVAYNKSKEVLKNTGAPLPLMLRIEAILRNKNRFAVKDVLSVKNPFDAVIVVSRHGLSQSKHSLIKEFASKIKKLKANAQEIFQHFPIYKRKLLTEALRKLQPTWWNPHEIWSLLPGATYWIDDLLKFEPSIA